MNGVISLADGRVVRWSLWSEVSFAVVVPIKPCFLGGRMIKSTLYFKFL